MTPIYIIIATLIAGIGSVWLAAALSFGVFSRYTQHMLSMAAGALLATAFMHLLPEAFESQAGAKDLFVALLAGLIFFFLLDKAELWHHGHEHGLTHSAAPAVLPFSPLISHSAVDCADHAHDTYLAQGNTHSHLPRPGSWSLLTGDSVHCFGDGVLIASAFMADFRLGIVAALAVLAHEIPHHMGDLAVLNQSSSPANAENKVQSANSKRTAVIKVSLAGSVTAIGGLAGYWLVNQLQDYLPYFLVIVSSSFIYVALADLIPQLQKHLNFKQTAMQIAWLAIGIALVTMASGLAHGH